METFKTEGFKSGKSHDSQVEEVEKSGKVGIVGKLTCGKVEKFDINTGNSVKKTNLKSYSNVFGETLSKQLWCVSFYIWSHSVSTFSLSS